ncbi:MAG: hypothetical protein ACOX6T_17570 [Myxococcales bacterium]
MEGRQEDSLAQVFELWAQRFRQQAGVDEGVVLGFEAPGQGLEEVPCAFGIRPATELASRAP